MSFDKRVNQLKLSHVHNVTHGTAPKYVSNYFIPVNSSHNIRTRSSQCKRRLLYLVIEAC